MAFKKIPPALLMLQARFPVAFDKPRRPLAVGIREEIRAHIGPEAVADTALHQALASHTGRASYLQAVIAAGSRRIHLDGSDAGEVSEESRRIAGEKLAALEAQQQASQQRKAESKVRQQEATPVKKKPKPAPAKTPEKATILPVAQPKPRKEKAVPVIQIKKRRVLVKT